MSEEEIQIDEYELRNCVATGNVSQIWEVVERGGTQHFAMKLLLPESFSDAKEKNVLKHEFKVGQAVDHPNIIRFYKMNISRDHAYFIMDYFRAPSLKQQISASHLDVQIRFRKLVESVSLALASVHESGWLHRDIKPDNILMNRGSEIRLIDFSLSTKRSGSLGKMFGGKMKQVQGTRTYIAPETLEKKKPTIQTDMYSLGITLYEALVGAPPFTGTSPNALLKKHILEKPAEPSFHDPNITPECDAFILHLLKKKPSERPADMTEVYAEFRNIKVFKEDPGEIEARKKAAAEEEKLKTVDKRLDSRLDAERTAKGIKAPVRKRKAKPNIKLKDVKEKEKKKPEPAAPQQPVAQPYPQQPMPGYMPMPQQPMYYPPPQQPMPYPQQPMPYQQMPGMPPAYPPQMPGQPPVPGQPMPYPQQPMPGQQMPQQPPMPQQPHPAQHQPMPQQPAPAQQPPAQPSPPPAAGEQRRRLPLERPKAPEVPKDAPTDLEEFTDLSEIDME
ncbi:MAG: serine/threonine protein kinase [Planctomycetaceae bacterium]